MKPVVVLANWMDENGLLNSETSSRLDKSIELLRNGRSHLLLMGWPCVKGCEISIAEAMESYCITLGVPANQLLLDKRSRDTVGDAIYSRLYLNQFNDVSDITVVSSDYHIDRVRVVFNQIYGDSYNMEFASARTGLERTANEKASIQAFHNTFSGIKAGDLDEFEDRMLLKHPFYNGIMHPKVMRRERF